jgi:hypothetical protein
VVGKVIPIALYIALYASVRAVQLSFTRIIIVFQLTGVPLGAQNVAPAARAVTVKKFFRLPPVGVGVEEEAVVVISSIVFVEDINVLFVSVSVLDVVTTFAHSTAIFQALTREIVVSDA